MYLATHGFTSLQVDLLERLPLLPPTPTNISALHYHLSDIIASEDTHKVWTTDPAVSLPNFPDTAVLTVLATTTPPSLPEGEVMRANTPTEVTVLLCLIRLEQQMTDVLVVLNVPHVPGGPEAVAREAGEEVDFSKCLWGSAVEEGKEVLGEVLKSLEIRDWGLFGPGG